ncbi:MAG: hypothetical protein OHK93_001720 [Ramalina farinacea]|uniref:Ankyrin n=1 Tax=Ramalina farinacea TaxID=258253 RepID=A0AA43TT43_9LECA|nr:hypothetical protein [Ramalina farinacea]
MPDSLITASQNPDPSILLNLAKSAARDANTPTLSFRLHDLSVAASSLIIRALASTDAPAAVGALLKAGLDPRKISMVDFMRSDCGSTAHPPTPDYHVLGHQGTPLCLASLHAKLPLIRHLLASGADPNLTNIGYGGDSLRPLTCYAAGWQLDSDAAEAMRVLMDEGGALQISAKKGREGCVKVLEERGADVEESVGKVEGGKRAMVLAREGGVGVLWGCLEVRGRGTDEGGEGRREWEGMEFGEGHGGGSMGGFVDSSAGDWLK